MERLIGAGVQSGHGVTGLHSSCNRPPERISSCRSESDRARVLASGQAQPPHHRVSMSTAAGFKVAKIATF